MFAFRQPVPQILMVDDEGVERARIREKEVGSQIDPFIASMQPSPSALERARPMNSLCYRKSMYHRQRASPVRNAHASTEEKFISHLFVRLSGLLLSGSRPPRSRRPSSGAPSLSRGRIRIGLNLQSCRAGCRRRDLMMPHAMNEGLMREAGLSLRPITIPILLRAERLRGYSRRHINAACFVLCMRACPEALFWRSGGREGV